MQAMHPTTEELQREPPSPQVLDHLSGCARCRLERRLASVAASLSPAATLEELWWTLTQDGERTAEGEPLLGRGPNGEVALAQDQEEAGRAVVKRLRPERLGEGKLELPSVAHPVLARCRIVDARRGLILRDPAQGQPLLDWAATRPAEEAWLRVVVGVASALEALHEAGEVHGNLRPANLWIRSDGQPMLLDPLPRGVESWARWDPAPELGSAAHATPASDLWSLGALLRATSRPPLSLPAWLVQLRDLLLMPEPERRLRCSGLLRRLLERTLRSEAATPLHLLGRGGMGEVYLVHDKRLDRHVARKFLRQGQPHNARRFMEEARITARLQHPGVVPVHSIGHLADGRPYYDMKEVEGRTLQELVDQEVMDLERRMEIFLRLCEPVAYAHSLGAIHRDLKPANVMVGAFGEVLVLDWGLVKVGSGEGDLGQSPQCTQAGSVIGTPAYMAPEQARGEEVGPAADVYALGAVLYFLLTGRCAYDGDTAKIVLGQVLRAPPPPPSTLAPDTPPELEALCMRAMARWPEERPPDAQALLEELEQALASWRAHSGSHALTQKALPHLDSLRRAVARGPGAGDEVTQAWDLLRGGLEQALALWPENERANQALAEARELLAHWTRAESQSEAAQRQDDAPDPLAEGILATAITRGERVAALVRIVVGCLGLGLSFGASADELFALAPKPLAIMLASVSLIALSSLLLAWLRKHRISSRLLLGSVTMDVLLALSVPFGALLEPTEGAPGLVADPGTYFVPLAVILSGARLTPWVATFAGGLATGLLALMTWWDLGRSASHGAFVDYFALYVLLVASWVFSVASAKRSRALVHRALAHARAAARSRRLLGMGREVEG